MNFGLFNLGTNFTEKADDEILDMNLNINEEGEFAPNSNATNDVDNHIPDANVSVPADKNFGSVWDHSVSVPDGLSETPKSKPYDANSVSVPGSTELTTDQWNKAMSALKQSFKEGVELMEMLESMKIVDKSKDQVMQEQMNNAMFEAVLQTLEDGPIFEEVERSDKKEVKEITRKLRKPLKKTLGACGLEYGSTPVLLELIYGSPNNALYRILKTRLWQYLGYCYCEDGNIESAMKQVNEKLADQLGEYKILHVKIAKNFVDAFRTKLGWKNQKNVYMLLVDRSVTDELKRDVKETCEQMLKGNEATATPADKK